MPNDKDPTNHLDTAQTDQANQTESFEKRYSDIVLVLDANNTRISWIASKRVAGKVVNVSGGWNGKFGSQLNGQIIVSPDRQIRGINVEIAFASLWTEHDLLTRVLATDGFFPTEEHPRSTFTCTAIELIGLRPTKLPGTTHWITGNFQLNGITRSISFPVQIQENEQSITCHSAFALDRQAFNIILSNPPTGFLLEDGAIGNKVAIELDIAIPLVLTSTAHDSYPTSSSSLIHKDSSVTSNSFPIYKDTSMTSGSSSIHENPSMTSSISPIYEVQSLKSDTLLPSFTETIDFSQIDFDMVLIPGDKDKAIAPFYMGRYEVTWDEFMPWAVQSDVDSEIQKGENRAMKLRPSQPWGQVTRGYGEHRFPALSMTRLAAELYCKWLSEQTSRLYRLPTEAEWEHAYQSGGGSLHTSMTETQAQSTAIYFDNSFNEEILDDATRRIGSKKPNSLGLYDMAGNVCEWVMTEGKERVARGGHFLSKRDELGRGSHIEDIDNWNMNYPNEPKSIWWYVDAKWVGFRVVCKADMAKTN